MFERICATAMRELAAAKGARPIGCTQVTEILNTPGVTLVGPLPEGCALATIYTGAVPPLRENAWATEFEKYKTSSQYQLLNKGMTLAEFKRIYWWEWAHRLLGRLIGAAFLLPLLFFQFRGWIEQELRWGLYQMLPLESPDTSCVASSRRGNSYSVITTRVWRPCGRGKVMKGGSYLCAPNYCRRYRPAARMAQPMDTSTCHLGLRLIQRTSQQPAPSPDSCHGKGDK